MEETVKDTARANAESAVSGQAGREENKIAILGHNVFREEDKERGGSRIVIELNVKNVLDKLIGGVVFEAIFSDKEGNIVETVEQKISDISPNSSRVVRLIHREDKNKPVENYSVKVGKISIAPDPTASGNDMVSIIKHNLKFMDNIIFDGLEYGIKNISDRIIASVYFECTFYDSEGNIVSAIKHRETNLRPNNSRGITIKPSIPDAINIRSYNIKTVRTVTADAEKVQIIKSDIRAEGPDREVTILCKNICSEKTDAAIVVTFFNKDKENIGTRVIPIRDMEPDTTRQFRILFKPRTGDIVKTYEVHVGDLIE
jgi:hypothetical protein